MPFPNSPIYTRPGETRPFRRTDRTIHSVFVHCSASDNPEHDDVSVIRAWHTNPVDRRGRGWKDVGYHFFVTKDGTVQPGRPVEQTPAAQIGHNAGTIAISLHGLEERRFTQPQLDSLIALCRAIETAYDGPLLRFRGHCEVANKACPVINYRQVLGLNAGGYLDGGDGRTSGMSDPLEPMPSDDLLDLMDRGPLVSTAQRALNAHGADLGVDGVFGYRTREAVIAFQERHQLRADGIIGPVTRAKLGL